VAAYLDHSWHLCDCRTSGCIAADPSADWNIYRRLIYLDMKRELFFAVEKTSYAQSPRVPLASICSIYGASTAPLEKVEFTLKGSAMTITALDVMTRILPLYPDYTITNLGPTECNVFLKHQPGSGFVKYLKAVLLCLVMFFGGAVAIMAFHEDVDMPSVHSGIYEFFTGIRQEIVPVVSIPYSIGIAVGFVMLFGLYRKKKNKPTVLDIDMHNHENEMRDYLAAKSKRPDG
jgi:stage V sporulation protein AA